MGLQRGLNDRVTPRPAEPRRPPSPPVSGPPACLPLIPATVKTLLLDKTNNATNYSACGAAVTVGATGVSVGAGAA